MMSSSWFVCSERADYPLAQQELLERDGDARMLWVSELDMLLNLISSYGGEAVSVALVCRSQLVDELECAIALLGETSQVARVLVMVTELDPACIARLFHAGASEVIAAPCASRGVEAGSNRSMEEQTRPAPVNTRPAVDVAPQVSGATGWLAAEQEAEQNRAPGDLRASAGDDPLPSSAWAPPPASPPANAVGPRAPVISVLSGRGGCGKSTLVASMSMASARLGLRTAVLDLDLMFGNLFDLLGAEAPPDMGSLVAASAKGYLTEEDLLGCAVRVGPGITLWGPVAAPEQAELMAAPIELLIDTLRRESDVIFIDTSSFWGDAVAAAVAASDRCLIVGDNGTSSASSAQRVIELASRVGVPRTCMTSVLNRFGARGCDEEVAMRFELTCALSSKARVADGGQEASGLLSFGRADELVEHDGPFAESVRSLTRETLVELGCSVGAWPEGVGARRRPQSRTHIRLPWKKEGDVR